MALPAVGDSVTETRLITEADVRTFAQVSGDDNPVHLDAEYAARTRFQRPIAHGMLVASMITRLAGTRLPGPGSIYLSQTLKFKAPCYVGEAVTATLTVTNVRTDKPLVTLSTVIRNERGDVLIDGEAIMFCESTGI